MEKETMEDETMTLTGYVQEILAKHPEMTAKKICKELNTSLGYDDDEGYSVRQVLNVMKGKKPSSGSIVIQDKENAASGMNISGTTLLDQDRINALKAKAADGPISESNILPDRLRERKENAPNPEAGKVDMENEEDDSDFDPTKHGVNEEEDDEIQEDEVMLVRAEQVDTPISERNILGSRFRPRYDEDSILIESASAKVAEEEEEDDDDIEQDPDFVPGQDDDAQEEITQHDELVLGQVDTPVSTKNIVGRRFRERPVEDPVSTEDAIAQDDDIEIDPDYVPDKVDENDEEDDDDDDDDILETENLQSIEHTDTRVDEEAIVEEETPVFEGQKLEIIPSGTIPQLDEGISESNIIQTRFRRRSSGGRRKLIEVSAQGMDEYDDDSDFVPENTPLEDEDEDEDEDDYSDDPDFIPSNKSDEKPGTDTHNDDEESLALDLDRVVEHGEIEEEEDRGAIGLDVKLMDSKLRKTGSTPMIADNMIAQNQQAATPIMETQPTETDELLPIPPPPVSSSSFKGETSSSVDLENQANSVAMESGTIAVEAKETSEIDVTQPLNLALDHRDIEITPAQQGSRVAQENNSFWQCFGRCAIL